MDTNKAIEDLKRLYKMILIGGKIGNYYEAQADILKRSISFPEDLLEHTIGGGRNWLCYLILQSGTHL